MPKYKTKRVEVEAMKVRGPISFKDGETTVEVKTGDWLVVFEDGTQRKYTDAEFKKSFDPHGRGAAEYAGMPKPDAKKGKTKDK